VEVETARKDLEAAPETGPAGGLLVVGGFRWLLASLVLIALASQVQSTALGLQVYAVSGKSSLALGGIGLAEALPFIAASLLAGYVADTWNRQRIALIALWVLLACALTLLCFAFLTPSGGLLWAIFAAVAVSGVARSFLGPARTALSAEVVPRPLFAASVKWRTAAWQIAAVAGPALGGVLYARGGAPLAYGGTIVLAAGALAFQALIRPPAAAPAGAAEPILDSLREGIAFLRHEKIILAAITLDLFAVLFGGAVALIPIYADILGVGPGEVGVLRAAPAAGAVLTWILLARAGPFQRAGRSLLVCVALFGVSMIAFGVSTSYPLSVVLLAVSGGVDYVSVVIRHTLVQVLTPPRMLGRIAAVNAIFIGSSNEIGAFESGAAAYLIGTVPSVVAGGLATLAVVAVTAWRVPELRRLRRIGS
jgi:MFS family permease